MTMVDGEILVDDFELTRLDGDGDRRRGRAGGAGRRANEPG